MHLHLQNTWETVLNANRPTCCSCLAPRTDRSGAFPHFLFSLLRKHILQPSCPPACAEPFQMRLKVTRSRHRMSKHQQTEACYKYRLDRRWPFPGRPCSQGSAAQLSPSPPWYHPFVCLQEWRQILANMPPFASPEQVSVELTCSTFSEFGWHHLKHWGPFSVMPWPPLRTNLYKLQ